MCADVFMHYRCWKDAPVSSLQWLRASWEQAGASLCQRSESNTACLWPVWHDVYSIGHIDRYLSAATQAVPSLCSDQLTSVLLLCGVFLLYFLVDTFSQLTSDRCTLTLWELLFFLVFHFRLSSAILSVSSGLWLIYFRFFLQHVLIKAVITHIATFTCHVWLMSNDNQQACVSYLCKSSGIQLSQMSKWRYLLDLNL